MKKIKKYAHFCAPYLLDPTNPVTVNLIGAGGTGSSMLTALARIDFALCSLGHAGLDVNVIDPDTIERANAGRLLFTEEEVGLPKAVAFVNRVNRTFGTYWKAFDQPFSEDIPMANIFISCVDSVDVRFQVADRLKQFREKRQMYRDTPYYWMDFGNNRDCGQVLLSTVTATKQPKSKKFIPVAHLPFVTDEYGSDLLSAEAGEDTPSCSLAEALEKQELFINSTVASNGAALLWQLFRKGMLTNRGFFINLEDFRMQSIKVSSGIKANIEKIAA
ncbi:PRTRC system ThiF family protein [Olivibacter sp. 47]|jgi:PRTRC genetic system ThiF family protein|uniref:PRTRC system ThiF family protein n=1 Tax=Olivibacter sp. 47 TaxID=3056486 RepID=UPI0025A35CC5|nr:PRTRC system ThiF family protein [Olivibacter sp. 47]MDM8175946.1 PRTRC system ThiF family protein [Olivibacter sp. 47]